MVGNRHSNAIAYVHDLLLSIRRNAQRFPPGATEAFDRLAATYTGSLERVDVDAVVRGALPPVRHHSGLRPAQRDAIAPAAAADEVPDLVKLVTPTRDVAFCFPNAKTGTWVRLGARIESLLVEELLCADGFPVFGRDLEALRGCVRPWTKVVWRVNDVASASGGVALIEAWGAPARVRGQRRKLDPREERADNRAFLIRPHRWRLASPLRVDTLEDAEGAVLDAFGPPPARRGAR